MHETTIAPETYLRDDAPEAATLAAARRLLAVEPALGRLFLAGVATQLRRYASEAAASPFREDPSNARRGKVAAAWADRAEAEQGAHGFGVGAAELEAAETAVEPAAVEVEATTGHGSFLASIYEHRGPGPRVPYFEARAEHRSDGRWKGAFVEVVISVDEVYLRFGRRVDDPGAAGTAAAIVGRWARVGRALLALP